MCGIFGTIIKERKRTDMGIMRGLTLSNRERGKEALGFFNSTGEIYKRAQDPIDVLASSECTEYLDRTERESWFIVGHTRYSTRGANIDKNSHPFEYGNIIGSHNGIIDAPNEYTVDSEYLIDLLDIHDSNYQTALENDWGYWTTSWYDKKKDELFLSMHDNSCGIVSHRGAWYFSSDPDHLAAAFGVRDTIVMKSGDTVSFDNKGRMKWRKKFETNMTYSYKKNARTSGGSTSVTGYNYGSSSTTSTSSKATTKVVSGYSGINDPANIVPEFDQDFRNLWETYSSEYESA